MVGDHPVHDQISDLWSCGCSAGVLRARCCVTWRRCRKKELICAGQHLVMSPVSVSAINLPWLQQTCSLTLLINPEYESTLLQCLYSASLLEVQLKCSHTSKHWFWENGKVLSEAVEDESLEAQGNYYPEQARIRLWVAILFFLGLSMVQRLPRIFCAATGNL